MEDNFVNIFFQQFIPILTTFVILKKEDSENETTYVRT